MGRALQLKDTLFGLDLTLIDTAIIFGFLSPTFLILMAPVSAMIAVFLTFLRMGTDRELVAAKAGGVSLYQLIPAPLLFGTLCALFTLWVSCSLIAWGAGNFRSLLFEIAQNRVSIALQPGTFNQDIPNTVFYARQVDSESGTLGHVMIEDSSREDANYTILAPRGNIDVDYLRGDILLLLQDGVIYTQQKDDLTQLSFEEYVVRFSLSSLVKGFDFGAVQPKEMHWNELNSFDLPEIAKKSTTLSQKIMVEKHKRFLFPVSCFVLAIFAIPIATSFQGLHRQTGLLLALGIFFAYYSIISLGMNLVEYNNVNPYIGIWLPVFIFLFLGIYGIRVAAHEKMPSVFEFVNLIRKRFFRKKSEVNS